MSSMIRSLQGPSCVSGALIDSKDLTIKTVQATPFCISGVGNLRALATFGTSVWVGGTEGKIAKTEDNGGSWSLCPIPEGEKLDVRALYLCNAQVACAMCAGPASEGLSRIYRTVDGGATWTLVLCPQTNGIFFNSMVFWNKREGILLSDPVDNRFVLFKTQDSGETWEQIVPNEMPSAIVGETAFAASNSCLAVQGKEKVWFGTGGGDVARVFYSSNGGQNWDVVDTPIAASCSAGIFSLAFCNDQMGIAVGGDYKSQTSFSGSNIVITKDGGRSWKPLYDELLIGKYLSSVVYTSDKCAMVVDCSQGLYNSVAITEDGWWAVGPNQNCARGIVKQKMRLI